ncbi:hypothetical protein SFUMM280S_07945 [Streptomyces fumanus]
MLACLQRGEADEAEHWLKLAALDQPPEPAAVYTPDLAARAEIALARGLTEVGLGLWRQALDKLREDSARLTGDPFMDPWSLELRSAALAAHALHGRLRRWRGWPRSCGRRCWPSCRTRRAPRQARGRRWG